MSQEIVDAVREIEREKGIESGTLVAALEDALLAAYKKTAGASRHATVELDDRAVEIATTSGTARPSACGQAITSKVTTRSMTNEASLPAPDHTTNVTTAAPIATIVRRNAARSASAWARERDVCA